MGEVGTYSFTHQSPSASASVRGWAGPSKLDYPTYSHDSQVSEGSSPNQGSVGSLPPHHESSQSQSEEGASPSSPGEQPGRPSFQCTLCPERKPYTQKQVLKRHYEKEHQPNSLINCSHCNHKWTRSREYDFRRHLKKKHGLEDNKINEILGRPPRRRRRKGRVIESDSPPHFSPASIERDRQSLAESQQRPLMLPLLAVRKDANHTSPPLIPSMVYNPRLGHAEPKVTATEHEDSSELEHLAATHAPKILSDEGFARLRSYLKIHGRIRIPSVYPWGSTSTDIPHNPGMLLIPALSSPVGGYHTSPVSGDPMVKPSRSTDPYYLYPGCGLL